MRKKERFVLGKRTFRSQKSKHFVLRIIQESVPLNESEKKICYLIKIGVKPGAIAILLNLGNASIYRKRLYEKLTGKKGNAKDLDCYISNL